VFGSAGTHAIQFIDFLCVEDPVASAEVVETQRLLAAAKREGPAVELGRRLPLSHGGDPAGSAMGSLETGNGSS